MNQVYVETARLLIQVAPLVFQDGVFALKGGTAINLFVRNMPRLSVDLDLVFIDHRLGREAALLRISEAIKSAEARLRKSGFRTYTPRSDNAGETKVFVRRDKLEVKIEVNYVTRGTVHSIRTVSLSARAKEVLQADLELPLVSLEDLYGGKLVAAMDRQHPRDLFDVMELFLHEGISPGIRRSFVVYLASHNRPIREVLFPSLRGISAEYEGTFKGMTTEPVGIQDLLSARERMVAELKSNLDTAERNFLRSLARNEPQWDLLGIEHLEQLPAIQWKLANLERLRKSDPKKHEAQAQELEKLLERGDH